MTRVRVLVVAVVVALCGEVAGVEVLVAVGEERAAVMVRVLEEEGFDVRPVGRPGTARGGRWGVGAGDGLRAALVAERGPATLVTVGWTTTQVAAAASAGELDGWTVVAVDRPGVASGPWAHAPGRERAGGGGRWVRVGAALTPMEVALEGAGWRVEPVALELEEMAVKRAGTGYVAAARVAAGWIAANGPAVEPRIGPSGLVTVHRWARRAVVGVSMVLLAASAVAVWVCVLWARARGAGGAGWVVLAVVPVWVGGLALLVVRGLEPELPAGGGRYQRGDVADAQRVRARVVEWWGSEEEAPWRMAEVDHPADGLDPRWRREFWRHVQPLTRGEKDPRAAALAGLWHLRGQVVVREGVPSGDWLAAWERRRMTPAEWEALERAVVREPLLPAGDRVAVPWAVEVRGGDQPGGG